MEKEKYNVRWFYGLSVLRPTYLVQLKVNQPTLWEKLRIALMLFLYGVAMIVGFAVLASFNANAILIAMFTFIVVFLFNSRK